VVFGVFSFIQNWVGVAMLIVKITTGLLKALSVLTIYLWGSHCFLNIFITKMKQVLQNSF